MIITISGKPGSGKTTVGRLLANMLGYRFISIGDIVGDLASKKETSVLEFERLAEKDENINKKIDQRQKDLKEKDNIILDSHLGFHFLPNSIKVFLDVDINTGAKRIFKAKRKDEKENISIEKTKENIRKRINSEKRQYKKAYSVELYDPKNFDVIIDTKDLTPERTSNKIIQFLKSPSFEAWLRS